MPWRQTRDLTGVPAAASPAAATWGSVSLPPCHLYISAYTCTATTSPPPSTTRPPAWCRRRLCSAGAIGLGILVAPSIPAHRHPQRQHRVDALPLNPRHHASHTRSPSHLPFDNLQQSTLSLAGPPPLDRLRILESPPLLHQRLAYSGTLAASSVGHTVRVDAFGPASRQVGSNTRPPPLASTAGRHPTATAPDQPPRGPSCGY